MEDGEDLDFVASEHDRLISAVTKLDKTQHITAPTRNEPTNLNSEFNLVKRSNKLNLLNAVKLLEGTAHHVQIGKKIKSIQNKSQVLPKPLEKPQAERIKRETGYVQTKKKIGRWDAVVARSRTIDCVSFPLKTLRTKEKKDPTKIFLSKLELKSPLEKELEEVDPPLLAQEEEDDEERKFPMTYEEMLEHRQHLARLRAKESYKAAKAKRQGKIKSKKYHRILKKEKLKQQLKEFEELQVKNPEEALKKLQELEKVRALERHTLRHKNTGKWAKSKLVRAKYDKEVRQQLAEQLSVSRSLTHKVQDSTSTDEEADNEVVPDVMLSQDPLNPWMMKTSDQSNIDEEFNFGYKKYIKDKMYKLKESSDTESDTDEDTDASKIIDKNDIAQGVLKNSGNKINSVLKDKVLHTHHEDKKQVNNTVSKRKSKKVKSGTPISTSMWIVDNISNNVDKVDSLGDISEKFESFESKVCKTVEEKLNKLRKDINKLDNISRSSTRTESNKYKEPRDNLEYLKLKNQKVKAIIDEALIETNKDYSEEDNSQEKVTMIHNLQTVPSTSEKAGTHSDIDPNRFIEVKPKYLNTAISKGVTDVDLLDDDDDEQVVPKVDIEEVFEEDDVVASFRQEKEDEINKDKPEKLDLTLPGWGTWGGKGVKAPKRKRNRFIGKPIPKMQRRDENKGDIIILETKDPKLSIHKVTDVPFPFNSVKDYEASIRAPLGNTFIPEIAHNKLIKPSVRTRAGAVIEPMDEEELLIPRKSFQNESILKLLAKK